MINQAFVLAAGLGKRMQPITNRIPKPMVEVNGRSLIARILDNLIACGIDKIVINAFYKGEMLKAHILEYIATHGNSQTSIKVIDEEELLETGGGIINALPHLDDAPFFVANSDVMLMGSNPFSYLAKNWHKDIKGLFLLTTKSNTFGYDGKGDFDLSNTGELIRRDAAEHQYIFPGIHISRPENFSGLQANKIPVMNIYNKFKQQDTYKGLYGRVYDGTYLHIGTPESVASAEKFLS
jgi:MurNAc alpha-1-phosphate uridylyltransferase